MTLKSMPKRAVEEPCRRSQSTRKSLWGRQSFRWVFSTVNGGRAATQGPLRRDRGQRPIGLCRRSRPNGAFGLTTGHAPGERRWPSRKPCPARRRGPGWSLSPPAPHAEEAAMESGPASGIGPAGQRGGPLPCAQLRVMYVKATLPGLRPSAITGDGPTEPGFKPAIRSGPATSSTGWCVAYGHCCGDHRPSPRCPMAGRPFPGRLHRLEAGE